jgi:hypothetical protein
VPVVALLVAAAAAIGAFGLEVVSLRRPTHEQLLAVQADRWLARHTAIRSVERIGNRRVSATCVRTWMGPFGLLHRRVRGSLVVTAAGALAVARGDIVHVGADLLDDDQPLSALEVELAGCTGVLAQRLSNALADRRLLGSVATTIGGRAAYRFDLKRRHSVLQLFVDPPTSTPIALHLVGPTDAWARLRPQSEAVARNVFDRYLFLTHPRRRRL